MVDPINDNKIAPALVLNGAGAKTAYQVGVIKAFGEILPDKICPFTIICGTSAGSINAAYISSRANEWQKSTEKLAELWGHIRLEQIYETSGLSLSQISSAWISRVALAGLVKNQKASNYMLDTKPLERLLSKEIDFPAISQHIRKGILQAVSFTSVEYFQETTVIFFDAHSKIDEWVGAGRKGIRSELGKQHVMASAAVPIFFPPIGIGDSFYGDGCLRQTSPLSPAIHLGADRIVSIGIRQERKNTKHVSNITKRQSPALAEILGELFNALFLDSLDPDIERLQRINDAIKNQLSKDTFNRRSHLKVIPILHLTPSRNLGELIPNVIKNFPLVFRYFIKGLGASDTNEQGKELVSYLAFTKECVEPLMSLGYEDTMRKKEIIYEFMNSKNQ